MEKGRPATAALSCFGLKPLRVAVAERPNTASVSDRLQLHANSVGISEIQFLCFAAEANCRIDPSAASLRCAASASKRSSPKQT